MICSIQWHGKFVVQLFWILFSTFNLALTLLFSDSIYISLKLSDIQYFPLYHKTLTKVFLPHFSEVMSISYANCEKWHIHKIDFILLMLLGALQISTWPSHNIWNASGRIWHNSNVSGTYWSAKFTFFYHWTYMSYPLWLNFSIR